MSDAIHETGMPKEIHFHTKNIADQPDTPTASKPATGAKVSRRRIPGLTFADHHLHRLLNGELRITLEELFDGINFDPQLSPLQRLVKQVFADPDFLLRPRLFMALLLYEPRLAVLLVKNFDIIYASSPLSATLVDGQPRFKSTESYQRLLSGNGKPYPRGSLITTVFLMQRVAIYRILSGPEVAQDECGGAQRLAIRYDVLESYLHTIGIPWDSRLKDEPHPMFAMLKCRSHHILSHLVCKQEFGIFAVGLEALNEVQLDYLGICFIRSCRTMRRLFIEGIHQLVCNPYFDEALLKFLAQVNKRGQLAQAGESQPPNPLGWSNAVSHQDGGCEEQCQGGLEGEMEELDAVREACSIPIPGFFQTPKSE